MPWRVQAGSIPPFLGRLTVGSQEASLQESRHEERERNGHRSFVSATRRTWTAKTQDPCSLKETRPFRESPGATSCMQVTRIMRSLLS